MRCPPEVRVDVVGLEEHITEVGVVSKEEALRVGEAWLGIYC